MALADQDPPAPEFSAEVADAILALMSESRKPWTTSDLVRALPEQRVLEVVLAVTALHRSGGLERVAPATYQLPLQSPARTRELNERRLWGS